MKWLAVGTLTLVLGWAVWVAGRHEQRTLERLLNASAVASVDHIKLLHSTGYLRENTHVFECSAQAILDESRGGIAFDTLNASDPADSEWIEYLRKLIDPNVKPAIEWSTAKIKIGDGKGLLTLVFVVSTPTRTFIILQVF
jgi:hypothetical protein